MTSVSFPKNCPDGVVCAVSTFSLATFKVVSYSYTPAYTVVDLLQAISGIWGIAISILFFFFPETPSRPMSFLLMKDKSKDSEMELKTKASEERIQEVHKEEQKEILT